MESITESARSTDKKQDESKSNLSQEEYKRLKYAFDSLDPDNTGKIDVEDLRFLLRCILRDFYLHYL